MKSKLLLLLFCCFSVAVSAQKLLPLGDAIVAGDAAKVKQLLQTGIDPNQRQNGELPITLAIEANNKEIFDIIVSDARFKPNNVYTDINYGAGFSVQCRYTPLCNAVLSQNPYFVEKLLNKGASADHIITSSEVSSDNTIKNPDYSILILSLTFPYSEDSYKIVDMIEKKCVRFNVQFKTNDQNDPTSKSHFLKVALMSSMSEKYNPIIQRHLSRGYNMSYLEKPSKASLDLLRKTAGQKQVDFANRYMFTNYLDYAIVANNPGMVQWLLDKGVRHYRSDDKGAMLLHKTNNLEIIKLLVKKGVDINAQLPGSKFNIFMMRYKDMKSKDFEQLLKMGADLNQKDAMGKTVFDYLQTGLFMPRDMKKNIKLMKKHAGIK